MFHRLKGKRVDLMVLKGMALENTAKEQVVVHCLGGDLSDLWIFELHKTISLGASGLS